MGPVGGSPLWKTVAVDMVDAMPRQAVLMVNPLRAAAARRTLFPAIPCVLLATMLVLSGFTMMSNLGLPGLLLCVIGLGGYAIAALGVLAWRGETMLGPSLAADEDGVWVRLGGMLRPKIAYLPWSEVSAVRCDTWAAPTGRTIPFVCFDADDAAETALRDPGLVKTTRKAVELFGTPFVVSDRNKDVSMADLVERIKPLAKAGGTEVEDLYLR